MSTLYSKKVLDHFFHPRNMGEIKNPDGMATVGNPQCGDVMRMFIKVKSQKSKGKSEEIIEDAKFQTLGCLPFEEEVVLSKGSWGKIGEVSLKTEVLNSDGEEAPIVKTFKRKYNGSLLRIIPFVSPFNSFSLTPDHPVLGIRRESVEGARKSNPKCDWLQIRNERELLSITPEYIKAKELREGDYLVFSYNQKVVDSRTLSSKMMRLLGYYLAEGYITAGTVVNFAFNKNERDKIEGVKSLVFDLTGKKMSERIRSNVSEIRFCSKKWADFFYSLAGRLARNKSLSSQILFLPFKKQWEMVKTYILGDGDFYRRRPKDPKTFRIITASKNLAIQIQEILCRGGIFAPIRKIFKTNCVIEGRKLKDSIQYLVRFQLKRKHKFFHKGERYFLIPIREIKARSFKGFVYNFQVGFDPNSYLVRGFAVHNCGAAIATSSIATEMIKGKPLKDALELTNQAIAEALGGLPKVKLHCSVLAAEAVKKAIEDYQAKSEIRSTKSFLE